LEREVYALSPEERVVHDLHRLGNTFCADGQGATTPDNLVSAVVEYLDRVVGNLFPPQSEFGERFLAANLSDS
jgi:ribosomal protein S12 methylthiotransferase accessory factor YcaO